MQDIIVQVAGACLLLLATGCGSGLDPAREPQRASCHVRANVAADKAWAAVCPDKAWDECPSAEMIAGRLDRALEECDKEAYPNGSN